MGWVKPVFAKIADISPVVPYSRELMSLGDRHRAPANVGTDPLRAIASPFNLLPASRIKSRPSLASAAAVL